MKSSNKRRKNLVSSSVTYKGNVAFTIQHNTATHVITIYYASEEHTFDCVSIEIMLLRYGLIPFRCDGILINSMKRTAPSVHEETGSSANHPHITTKGNVVRVVFA